MVTGWRWISKCPWCGTYVVSADDHFIHLGEDGYRHAWLGRDAERDLTTLGGGTYTIPWGLTSESDPKRLRGKVETVDDDSWRAKLEERLRKRERK